MARQNLDGNPLWYKDAVIYEARVRSFSDSDSDGIGDFRGLTEKLGYLQDLGINTLWLLPFYPSPLRDDGYDISDYTSVHPDVGSLSDFKVFLREAHRLGLRVVTELVVNHTSDQHLWFQRARRARPGSAERDFYVWSDTPERYGESRIIFKDFEPSNWAWDPVVKSYYWHRFYSHQPDLNYDNPAVQKALFQAMDFWLALGVDGLRLDAVPYLYEREGTNCENLPETHLFLKNLRRHVDRKFKDRMLLAEANQWPEDAVAYFGGGDECNMAFHFPIMPRMFMSVQMEDRYPLIDILEQTPEIPPSCQWALFLRNHDELTLEMVTEEERDYMYRAYANDPRARINLGIRRRLAPLLGNDRKKIELMNSLLFSLPGTPVIYYGDEIGMGDNFYLGDRNGVRTPMQWSGDRNAGFSRANPQRLFLPVIVDPEYHFESINVEVQQNNPHSLLWWMKRLIALRKNFKAFGRGTLTFLHPQNRKVLAFIRQHEDERILVVANLSRFVQFVELDLSPFRGMSPLELFGRTRFPLVGESPYFLTMAPHTFLWFSLVPEKAPDVRVEAPREQVPLIEVRGDWDGVLVGRAKADLEALLPDYLRARRWFGGKARPIKGARIVESFSVPYVSSVTYLAMVQVDYAEGAPETYVLPLTFATGEHAKEVTEKFPWAAVALLRAKSGKEKEEVGGVLCDALSDSSFCRALLLIMSRRRRIRGKSGELVALPTSAFERLRGEASPPLQARLMAAEQSNTSINYGDKLILKIFRRCEEGVNPDVEITRFLAERTRFASVPPAAGFLEFRKSRGEGCSLAILQGYVPNQGDAWQFTLDEVEHFFERVLTLGKETDLGELASRKSLVDLSAEEPPALARDTVGAYLNHASLLGRRTAELHLSLASDLEDPNFAPEPFTSLYQRSLYQSMRNLTRQTFQLFRDRVHLIPESVQEMARRVLRAENQILDQFQVVRGRKFTVMRIRSHGDYHLGQVLYTGKDFVIIDFEGEPARPMNERRLKRAPLRDLAGMLRSYHYAACTPLSGEDPERRVRPEDVPRLMPWAEFWYRCVGASFLKTYFETASKATLLPKSQEETALLLQANLLEKAIYELGYELNNRPSWVGIPIRGIAALLELDER